MRYGQEWINKDNLKKKKPKMESYSPMFDYISDLGGNMRVQVHQ
jgi:hypothetical protein